MRVDIWSDLVCPWCYLGKRRFEHAIATVGSGDDIEVVHRSFQLDPLAPKGQTGSRRKMLMAKYGWSQQQVEAIDAKMEQTAARDGLEYHLTASGLTGNTSEAHQLVHLAGDRGIQDQVIERFFRAYFTEQRSLFDAESLVALGIEAGLDEQDIRYVLGEGTYVEAVADDNHEARRLGANGVPFFVIDDRYGISGAQPIEVFIEMLTQSASAR